MITLHLPSLEALPEVAREFAAHMGQRTIFAFYGKMGAGKTTLIKELVKVLGSDDVVNSPTFAIVNEYECVAQNEENRRRKIFHFDFYRINKLEEAYDMGYDEYFDSGHVCFIEWPELIEPLLPEDAVRVTIVENEDKSRDIVME